MTAFIIISFCVIALLLFMAFRPRKKDATSAENDWRNPNFEKNQRGESFADSPPEQTGYL